MWVLLRGTAWGSRSFFHQLHTPWFLQPEVVGTYLLGTEPWAGGPGVGLGLLAPEVSLPNFYSPFLRRDQPMCLHPSYQSGWIWSL